MLEYAVYYRIRQELKDLHAEGKQEYKEIENNEQKFLALELPSRHNEGVYVHILFIQ